MRTGIVSIATVGLVAAGCGTGGEPTAANRATVSEPRPCRSGTASPITEEMLVSAFSARGIQLHRDHPDNCAPDALLALSNTAVATYEEEVRVREAQGDIFCHVYPADIWGDRIERFVWRNDPDPTWINVLNVGCAHYPEKPGQTDKLEEAFRKLPGVGSEPTTVPSSDAIHD
jgi:hypothetical protein